MAKLDHIEINGTPYELVPEIAPLFNASTQYSTGDYVIKDAILYKFITNHAAGAWNASHVTATSVIDEINGVVDNTLTTTGKAADAKATGDALASKINGDIVAPEFSDSTAYSAGSYVLKNGVLYKFTSAHSGAWTGTDAEVVTVGGEVEEVKADLNHTNNQITNIINDGLLTNYVLYQGSRAFADVDTISNSTTRCTADVINFDIGDSVIVENIPSGYKIALGAVYSDGTTFDSGWKTSDYYERFRLKAGKFFVNAATNSGSGNLTPDDVKQITIIVVKSDFYFAREKTQQLLNGVIDDACGFINYGYDKPNRIISAPGSTSVTAFGIERDLQFITLNGGGISSAAYIKINGLIEPTTSTSTIKNFASTLLLEVDHKYIFRLKWISGTISGVDSAICPTLVVYKSGASSTSGSGSRTDDGKEYIRNVLGDGNMYSLAIYVQSGMSFENAVFSVTMEDVTAKKNENFDYFNELINGIHRMVDYGYGNQNESYPVDVSATGNQGSKVGVDRYGTDITLNYAGTSYAKRVRISGGISRVSGNDSYKDWIGNLQLVSGKEYRYKIRKKSGTGTLSGNNYIPILSVYVSNGATSIATEVKSDETYREYSFVAPDGPVSLAIYIAAASVLTNFACSVTLEEYVSSETTVNDYYLSELSDTISKTRNEITSPALVFLWSTDNHRYSSNADGVQNFGNMIANMKAFAKEVPCDFVLDTGDLTDGNTTQDTTLKRAYICLKDFMSIDVPYVWSQGNHDTNYAVSGHPYLFTMQECFKAYFTATKGVVYNASENGTEFYMDYDGINTRLISLNANNCTNNVEYAYGQSTADWLSDALDTDKNVILVVHQSPVRDQVYGRTETTRASGIVTALQTFVTNGGNLIMISGHSHRDVAFISPWVSIMQDCQRFSNTPNDIIDDGSTEMVDYIDVVLKNARVQYTASEDLWSACVYKPDSNELSLIRFGAGYDRYFHVTPIAPTTLTTKLAGTITWSSSDTSVATVSDGVITGAATGKCAVLAKDETGNYECWIIAVT